MRVLALVLFAMVALAGCGDSGTPTRSNEPRTSTSAEPHLSAPDFRLHLASGPVDLKAWTACYGNGCYDGSPPHELVDVGRADAVEFSFGRGGWTFDATFRESGGACPRQITVPAERLSATRFRVEPAGNAGSWDVDVFGRGPGGDAITTFHWTTGAKGTFPDHVTSSLAVLADHDGDLDSYGVELGISDLARTPDVARATVTVIAESGEQAEVDLGRADGSCDAAGSLYWTRDRSTARSAVALPGTVFRYVVHLTLDGTAYTGRGTWPTDTDEDITPAVRLTWTPELPVYRG